MDKTVIVNTSIATKKDPVCLSFSSSPKENKNKNKQTRLQILDPNTLKQGESKAFAPLPPSLASFQGVKHAESLLGNMHISPVRPKQAYDVPLSSTKVSSKCLDFLVKKYA